jgi:multidrug efflux pump subunit AcrA (membrane-fusion protein)
LNKRTITQLLPFLALLLIGLLPFRIPYHINTFGKVSPQREWLVIQDPAGRITTRLFNHKLQMAEQVSITEVQRGDALQFQLAPTMLSKSQINAGDTVATLQSPDLIQAIMQLQGQLSQARALRLVYASSEKEPLLQEARQQIQRAHVQVEEQRRVVNRLKQLHEKELVSGQEYELALAMQRIYESDMAMAQARLNSLQSGAKAEQLDLVQAQIDAISQELQAMQLKAAAYVLRSPITGSCLHHVNADTLFSVAEADSFVITMMVKMKDRALVRVGQKVDIKLPAGDPAVFAEIVFVNPMLERLGTEQAFWVIARTPNVANVLPGLLVTCEIQCDPLTKLRFLQRIFD